MELKGKKINFMGDSITEGVGTSGMEVCYPALICRAYGLAEARNYGISGTRFSRCYVPSENPRSDLDFCGRIGDLDADADAVVIFGGTNDYGAGSAPFGDFADRTSDTFCGACHALFSGVKARFPNGKILIITPIHRYGDAKPSCDPRARNARPLMEYVEVIKATAAYYDLPVLDLFAIGILNPNDPAVMEGFVPDGLHPNDAGQQVLAKYIGQKLAEL